MTTQTGTVKWFNESKGYGFIAQDAGGAVHFHVGGVTEENALPGAGLHGPCAAL